MRAIVTFHALWLVSERDASARRETFSPTKNLLAGINETGKSRVLKHMVWTLGCEPAARNAGSWDSNITAATELSIGSKKYIFLRSGRHQRAAFDADGKLVIGTESAKVWTKFFVELFDFPLKLQRQQEGLFGLAGPEYAILPFYIDQEGGWSRRWAAFSGLGKFLRWEPIVFEAFTGLRPQRYFLAQLRRDEIDYKLREAKIQARLQSKAFEQVSAMLPESRATLDEHVFANELRELADRAAALSKEEDEIRSALVEAVEDRQIKVAELQMVMRAEEDLVGDLAYLSKIPDEGQLTCPTCGQVHDSSFRAKVELATDAEDAHQLVISVRSQLASVQNREQDLRAKLQAVSSSLNELRVLMAREREGTTVGDIIAAKSRTTLEQAYDRTKRDLSAQIDEFKVERDALQAELAGLTEKGREKQVRNEFKDELNAYADRLGISKAEIGPVKIGARPGAKASGSSSPRIYLAMHMALLALNRRYGNGPAFPFMVDTPRQQGLDDANTAKLLDTIYTHAPSHQVFVANESVPQGWTPPEGCKVIPFVRKRQLLRTEEYKDGVAALEPLVTQMLAAIEAEREAKAQAEQAEGEEEHLIVLPSDSEEVDDADDAGELA
ncbi:hypothetical protein [Ottowia beijingensis]|uniref:hypothetical protein n=1 Tax=Ottowia beijingensis TaxID=1207057 RepID=UPI003632A6C4